MAQYSTCLSSSLNSTVYGASGIARLTIVPEKIARSFPCGLLRALQLIAVQAQTLDQV
jgi:hypothetical protein